MPKATKTSLPINNHTSFHWDNKFRFDTSLTIYLGCKPYVIVPHKTRVWVVLCILPLNVVFQVKQRAPRATSHFHNTHLHDVNLIMMGYVKEAHKTRFEWSNLVCTKMWPCFMIIINYIHQRSTCLGGLWRLNSSPHNLASICNLTSSK